MRNITIVTGTRAEYGLLKNIMREINRDNELNLQIIVTGTHLSARHGMTVDEIINDGFIINERCSILLDSNERDKNAREMSIAISKLASAFKRLETHILLILGDRYEIFAAAATAMIMNIPIAHISGGEVTEGAIDEQIRHSITKMAHLHFPGAQVYADNIKKMGEEEWRIFNVGDPGIENIKLTNFMNQEEIYRDLGVIVDENTLLVTYHPVTLQPDRVEEQINNLIKALSKLDNTIIITYPNADNGGSEIIKAIDQFASQNSNVYSFSSLGSLRYLSVMKCCGVVVGNSSSALVEAPFLKKAVVNIGDRQKGRLMANNIIQSSIEVDDIYNAIIKAFSKEFKEIVMNTESLYGEGNTSTEMVNILKKVIINERLLRKKLSWSIE